jgi:hypothetical protein
MVENRTVLYKSEQPFYFYFQRSDYHVNLFTTIFSIISNIADILSN